MTNTEIKRIVSNIKNIFLNSEHFELRKSVEEVTDKQGGFLGDFVNFMMVDKNANPPIFYSVGGPFDVISKRAPQHALVWQDGKLLVNTDYTEYADMRTGAMDSIAIKLSNIDSLANKNILLFGTGNTAKWSLKVLKVMFNDLEQISYINSSNTKSVEFEKFANDLGIKAVVGTKNHLATYDIIICHTNASSAVLTEEDLSKIKEGAIITTFIGSEVEHGELGEVFYSDKANIILDWKENLIKAKDIKKSGVSEDQILFLSEILMDPSKISETKSHTVFRFLGTPMQNLAVLETLIPK